MMKKNKMDASAQDVSQTSATAKSIIGRPDIPTLYIDKFIVAKRNDGCWVFNGIQTLPEVEVEQLRFMISSDYAKRFLDKFAQIMNYYPQKPLAEEKKD